MNEDTLPTLKRVLQQLIAAGKLPKSSEAAFFRTVRSLEKDRLAKELETASTGGSPTASKSDAALSE